ncbi:MAG: ABC transporter substrate-binding protein [Candidatus Rokubacteria bacterium]|nr:ABC transporter substrate-binding protein [Candidatus Rokubacteria bacterium]
MIRRAVTLLSVLLIAVGLLWPAAARADRDTLSIGLSGIPDTMDPHLLWSTTWMPSYYALYDALTVIGDNNDAQPNLAVSWKRLNPTTWEFKLRDKVKFHNGEPFTSESVKFTLDRVIDPATKAAVKNRVPTIKAVEAVDPLTVRIVTAAPDPNIAKTVSVVFILPAKYAKEKGPAGFAEAPVGTGMFRLAEFRRNGHVKLEAVDNGWRPMPKVKTVIFKHLPENGTRIAALRSGDVDFINPVPPDEAAGLEKDGFKAAASYTGWSYVIPLKGSTQAGSPLANPKVRQALNYAVDKDAIIKYVLHGYGKPLAGQNVGQDGFGYNPALKPFPADAARARELLKQAGYPNGFEATWFGTVGFYPNDKQVIEAIVGDLAKVGVRVKLQTVDQGSFAKHLYGGTLSDLVLLRWTYFPSLDFDFVVNLNRCQNSTKLFCDERVDRMLDESRQASTPVAREKMLQKISELLYEGPNAIYLFQPGSVSAMTGSVKGFRPRSEAILWLDTVEKEK